MEEIVYDDVSYKGEPGTLTVNDKVFHYQAHATKTSVKCSWARVEKRQLSPETAKAHMIKLILISGKTAVFTVADRASLEELRNDMQARMEAARGRNQDDMTFRSNTSDFTKSMKSSEDKMDFTSRSTKSVNWQDEPVKPKAQRTGSSAASKRSTTSVQRYEEKQQDRNDGMGWCCFGTLFCWLLVCCICVAIAIAAFLVYWFVLKDSDVLEEVGIVESQNKSLPPDWGHEERYGIRAVEHEWDSEEVTLSYRVSDYILENSISYKVYDGLGCRTDANDITRSNQYLFIDFQHPKDEGPNLSNRGTGTRGPFDLTFSLNKGQISDAPFFVPIGLNTAQLNFCIGLSIDYNQVEWWKQKKEVSENDSCCFGGQVVEYIDILTVLFCGSLSSLRSTLWKRQFK